MLNKVALLPLAALMLAAACSETPSPYDQPPDGAPRQDGTLPTPDAGPPRKDGAPDPDAAPRKDGAPPLPDGALPPDKGQPGKDSAMHPALYPAGRTQSPITPSVVKRLKAVVAAKTRSSKVFAKVGNSITVSTGFMHCFAGSAVDLAGRTQLAPTVSHFKATVAGGKTPYNRTSLCATSGWPAFKALAGSPSPLSKEVSAISPRFAAVMYGSNDIGYKKIHRYADNMLDITDQLLKEGVIPLLSSIPPRDDSATANADVPRYNAVVRAIAQGRQVPFVDYHRELMPLPKHGLSGDGVHPRSYSGGSCKFTAAALKFGYNVRNLITIQGLHRAKAAALDNKPAPDPPGPARLGRGSQVSPLVMDKLPWSDLRSTKGGPYSKISSYPGCSATQDESGPEYIYRLKVTSTTNIRALVFDRGTVDIDIHLLGATISGQSCIKRAHQQLTATLQPGTYHFALDTFTKGGVPLAGEYIFVVLKE